MEDDINRMQIDKFDLVRVSGPKVSISQSNPKEFSWIDLHILIKSLHLADGEYSLECVNSAKDISPEIRESRKISLVPILKLKGLGPFAGIDEKLQMIFECKDRLLQAVIFQSLIRVPQDALIAIKVTQLPNKSKKKVCKEALSDYPWITVAHNKLNQHWDVQFGVDIYLDGKKIGMTGCQVLNWKTNKANKMNMDRLPANEEKKSRE